MHRACDSCEYKYLKKEKAWTNNLKVLLIQFSTFDRIRYLVVFGPLPYYGLVLLN